MKKHSVDFKNEIKNLGKQLDVTISYDNETLDNEVINLVTARYNGNLFKSVMKELEIDSNINIPLNKEIALKVGLFVNGAYEYIDFGTYIVKEVEKQEDTNSYLIKCYDKMLYSMKKYEAVKVTYPCTVRTYITKLCEQIGLDFANKNDTFTNSEKTILNELYLTEDSQDIGYTYRDVLDELAEVTASTICLKQGNIVELKRIQETNDTIDAEYLKDVNVNFGEKFGPINSVVLSRAGESDNIFKQDEQSIHENGLCEIKFIENQILNFNNRYDFIDEIFKAVNGIEYYLNDFNSTGILYYDLLDKYTVKIENNEYGCIMLNDEITISQGLEETIYTERLEQNETDYTKADKTDIRTNYTQLIVDKQKQQIKSMINQIGDRGSKKTSLTQDVDGLKSLVELSQSLTQMVQGVEVLTFRDCIKNGKVVELHIYGNNTAFGHLYPSKYLTPWPDLVPDMCYGYVTVVHIDAQGNKLSQKRVDLGIRTVLRQADGIYDEYILTDNSAKVIRRINEDGTVRKTPVTELIEGNIEIPLEEGDNMLILDDYIAVMNAIYVPKNAYSEVFATKVDLNTQFNQTNKNIELLAQSILATNLLKYTAFPLDRKDDAYKVVLYDATAQTKTYIDGINKYNACNSLSVQFIESGTHLEVYNPIQFSTYGLVKKGDNLYLSFYIKSPIDGEIDLMLKPVDFQTELLSDLGYTEKVLVQKDKWLEIQINLKKVTQVSENIENIKLNLAILHQDVNVFNIANIMLEVNEYPTQWTKAPQDTNELVDKNSVVASLNLGIKDGQGAIVIKGNYLDLDTDQLKIKVTELLDEKTGKKTKKSTLKILANPNKKYMYTPMDIDLATRYLKEEVKYLPPEIIDLYSINHPFSGYFNVADVQKMKNIYDRVEGFEPVYTLKDVGITDVVTIDPDNPNETIKLAMSSVWQTIISLYSIITYMIKTNYLVISKHFKTATEGNWDDLSLGITLDGNEATIKITNEENRTGSVFSHNLLEIRDDTNQVGAIIKPDLIDVARVYAANGGAKGSCLHSGDLDIGGPDHDYVCHWDGTHLMFYVDPGADHKWGEGTVWIDVGTSDIRLKTDIKPINENLLKAINEIELKQFRYKEPGEYDKLHIGIMAQELVEICEKYNVNIKDYDIVMGEGTETSYYAINYSQLQMLKTKCLENKVNSLENKIDELYNLLKGGKK